MGFRACRGQDIKKIYKTKKIAHEILEKSCFMHVSWNFNLNASKVTQKYVIFWPTTRKIN